MSKFVIECPSCGRFAEAKTGFFARKKIDCACGYVINVATDKMTSLMCPHCGNVMLYDQSKGTRTKCPVCGQHINAGADAARTFEFSCAQCGVRHRASKGAATFTCPVCDYVNDLGERLKDEEIKKRAMPAVIKYEGDVDTLVFKHPIEDFKLGSQLIVHDSQTAVFFRDGEALDSFGPGRYTLETENLPLMDKVYKLPTGGQNPFHCEVYFVNLSTVMAVKWGTDSKVRLFDPGSGIHVELGANGEFNIRVADPRRLLNKIVGTTDGLSAAAVMGNNTGRGIFRTMIMTHVKSYLASTIRESGISVLEIDEHLMELSTALGAKINAELEPYGLVMPEFYVKTIMLPMDDKNFVALREQYAEQVLRVRRENIERTVAEAEAQKVAAKTQVKLVGAQGEAQIQRIQAQAKADAYRMQAEAEAAEMKMKGYTQRDLIQADVQKAYAEGIGNMGPAISGGGGSSVVGDLLGLGVGMAAATTVAPQIGNMMQGFSGLNTPVGEGGWTCPGCGRTGIDGKFCPECGTPKPAPEDSWDCACGKKGVTSKFCPECGSPKPVKDVWDCACGRKGITSKFCPECGNPKPVKETWDCACGAKGITSKFCPECGSPKPAAEEQPAGWTCPNCGAKGIVSRFCPECGFKKTDE